MNSLKNAALVVATVVGGAYAYEHVFPKDPAVVLQNVQLIRSPQSDGGTNWVGRACAYETIAGVTGEPCWNFELQEADVQTTTARVLSLKH